MIDLGSLTIFITAGLLLNITPGPDVLYIVGRSLGQGRAAGVVSALGIATGTLFHVAAATSGLSALMAAQPLAYDAVRYAGAAYLVWLGIQALRSKGAALTVRALDRTPLRQIFFQGVTTNALNPKVAIFFLAFLPQFTDPARGPVWMQMLALGLIFQFNGLLVCIAYALVADRIGAFLRSRFDVAGWLTRAMGGLFILLGLRLALGDRR